MPLMEVLGLLRGHFYETNKVGSFRECPNYFCTFQELIRLSMKNLVRAIIAGIGAKKIGGGRCGCVGTIVVFLILYWLLGYVFDVF